MLCIFESVLKISFFKKAYKLLGSKPKPNYGQVTGNTEFVSLGLELAYRRRARHFRHGNP